MQQLLSRDSEEAYLVDNKHGMCQNQSCDSRRKLKVCNRCGSAKYCSRECQKADWKLHKKICGKIQRKIAATPVQVRAIVENSNSRRHGICILFFDGACRANPKGPNGYGYCITSASDEDELLTGHGSEFPNQCSNNYMEYTGLIQGLRVATGYNFKHIEIRGDSELVINQVKGIYKVNDPLLKNLYDEIVSTMEFETKHHGVEFSVMHIPRADNVRADTLANEGLEKGSFKNSTGGVTSRAKYNNSDNLDKHNVKGIF